MIELWRQNRGRFLVLMLIAAILAAVCSHVRHLAESNAGSLIWAAVGYALSFLLLGFVTAYVSSFSESDHATFRNSVRDRFALALSSSLIPMAAIVCVLAVERRVPAADYLLYVAQGLSVLFWFVPLLAATRKLPPVRALLSGVGYLWPEGILKAIELLAFGIAVALPFVLVGLLLNWAGYRPVTEVMAQIVAPIVSAAVAIYLACSVRADLKESGLVESAQTCPS